MVVGRKMKKVNVRILNDAVEQVDNFIFLGSNKSSCQKVKRRIAVAKEAFNRKRNLFEDKIGTSSVTPMSITHEAVRFFSPPVHTSLTVICAFRIGGSRSSGGLHFPRVLTPILDNSPQLKSAGTAVITNASRETVKLRFIYGDLRRQSSLGFTNAAGFECAWFLYSDERQRTSLLVYADDLNMLGENPQMIRENTGILLEASKAIGLEVNPEKTKYMIVSRDQNIVRNGNIKIGNLSFEEVEKFKYLGATATNTNNTREEIKHTINMGNACYYSVEKLLSSRLVSKNLKGNISEKPQPGYEPKRDSNPRPSRAPYQQIKNVSSSKRHVDC
ncbi:hypothetical protein ANN_02921 [Periplaneta americana]|uniref:Reverse transcriptase domain-containing protein n=1 Tax=Periplaneta americana TaxID=6978 RepID=A0ABQ8U1B0_PERAM|nr:hypothetical protein ANN_02921 [Periplaneta americana]